MATLLTLLFIFAVLALVGAIIGIIYGFATRARRTAQRKQAKYDRLYKDHQAE